MAVLSSILVYRLVPAATVARQVTAFAERIFGVRPGGDNKVRFRVSDLSGCILYLDDNQLRNRGNQSLPDQTEARTLAQKFMENANRIIGARSVDGLTQIFPPDLRHLLTAPVYVPDRAEPDHWRVRFMALLDTGSGTGATTVVGPVPPQQPVVDTPAPPAGDTVASVSPAPGEVTAGRLAPVVGGVVEIRVGGSGKIIGVVTQWRPYRATEICKRLPPPPDATADNCRLIYLLGGNEEPMEFIAPYYFSPDEDDPDSGTYYPASDRSILVDFYREDGPETTTLSAVVSGNAGALRFAWAAWRIDLGPSAGVARLGTGRAVSLPPGVYNVVVDVQDATTGAFARAQATVHSGPRPDPPA